MLAEDALAEMRSGENGGGRVALARFFGKSVEEIFHADGNA